MIRAPLSFPPVALIATLAAVGCGVSPGLGPPPDGDDGSTSSTSSTGSVGSTGTGGTGGTGSTGAGGAGVPICTGSSSTFEGVLDGQPVSGELSWGFGVELSQNLVIMLFGTNGMIVMPAFITDPTPHPLALLRMPDEGPFPGTWFGFGVGSELPTSLTPPGGGFVLTSAVQLGTCPGAPVSGQLSFCDGCGGQPPETTVSLDGQAVPWTAPELGGVLVGGWLAELSWQNNAFLAAEQSTTMVGLLSMPLDTGMPSQQGTAYMGPDVGAIFCIDGGEIGVSTATFTDLSFLTTFGAAPAVTGTIRGCF